MGDSLTYDIRGSHNADGAVTTYTAAARGVVLRDSAGRFVEDYTWSSPALGANPDSSRLHQRVSLEPSVTPMPPDFRRFDARLAGPALDFLTFYVDLWLAGRMPTLTTVGSRAHVPFSVNGNWADGRSTLLGQDAVEFEFTIVGEGKTNDRDSVILSVRHTPPAALRVRLPAAWMRHVAVDSTLRLPNNWVQVTRKGSGASQRYTAAVGIETFGVSIVVARADGHILHASMENPVDGVERVCRDAELSDCEPARSFHIMRRIALIQR